MNYELSQVQRQLDHLRSQNQQIEQLIRAEQQERISALISASAREIQGIRHPKQLLTLLQGEGKLVEQAGVLMAKTDQGLKPLAEELPTLLKSDEYNHFRAPTTSAPEKGRFLKGGDRTLTSEELQQVLSDPDKSSELFDEVQQGMGQPTTPTLTASSSTAVQPSYDSVRPQPQRQSSARNLMLTDAEIEKVVSNPALLNQLAAKVEQAMQ